MRTRVSASDPLAAILNALTQADDNNKKSAISLTVRPLTFVELMTTILTMHQNLPDGRTPLRGMIELIKSEKLFIKQTNQQSVLSFLWPHTAGERTINVRFRQHGEGKLLSLDFQSDQRRFMTITARDNVGVTVKLYPFADGQQWSQQDIHELLNCFNVVLCAKQFHFKHSQVVEKLEQPQERHVFFSEEYERILGTYKNYPLTYQVNHAVLNRAEHHLNTYTFYLYWTDSKKHLHPLRVMVERGVPFTAARSRFMTEQNLIDLMPSYQKANMQPGQLYYQLKVEELTGFHTEKDSQPSGSARLRRMRSIMHEDHIQLFALWVTLDGLIGELRNVTPSMNLSGNEVLRIYQYFASMLSIESVFICDESTLEGNSQHVSIPLRLITAIANGKTWLEQHLPGLRLFDKANIPVPENNTIHQNNKRRMQALQELQALPLTKWAMMLDEDRQAILKNLYQKFFPAKRRGAKGKQDEFGEQTIQSLTAAIYHDAKKNADVTDELAQLTQILCGNIGLNFGNILLDSKSRDYWVQSRVHQLMWGSYIWKHQASSELHASDSADHRSLP